MPRPAIEPLEPRRLRTTFAVTTTDFWSNGGLWQAFNASAAGDTLDLSGVHGTLNFGYVLNVTHDLNIVGPGSGQLTLTCGGQSQAFTAAAGTDLSVSGLTVDGFGRDGYTGGAFDVDGSADNADAPAKLTLDDVVLSNDTGAETGGAIYAAECDLTMTNCRVTGCTANGDVDALGGGVYLVGGTFAATGCTFDHNAAVAAGTSHVGLPGANDGGAMGGGLALMQVGATSLTNCTVANNRTEATPGDAAGSTATSAGGGLVLAGIGDFTMTNCTVADNASSDAHGADAFGGGVMVLGFTDLTGDGLTLAVQNSVLAGNTAAVGPDAFGLDVSGANTAVLKNDVVGVATDSGITAGRNNNAGGTAARPLDAGLNGLADNGGATPTMRPDSNSPAVGRAVSGIPKKDQRGHARGTVSSAAGAYTLGDSSTPTTPTGPTTPTPPVTPTPPSTPDPTAPVVAAAPNAVAATDRWYASTVKADAASVRIAATNKPDWLTVVDNGDGTATLSGTPAWVDAGDESVTLKLTGGGLTTTQTFALAVAATPVVLTTDGVLRVVGTDADDTVHVWQPRGPGTPVRVAVGRRLRNYDAASVTSVEVYGRGGDDDLTVNCADFGAYVNAGAGNDTVTGGDGNDSLSGADGADVIDGMGGDDLLHGNGGRDWLDGGAGNDRLAGDSAHDTLTGGAGRDVLYGGAGPDDFVTNDGERDWLFGNDGTADGEDNLATTDRRDILTDVTAL